MIFVLGDAHSGLTSMSNFLSQCGFKVQQQFERYVSGSTRDEMWASIQKYILESGKDAFSDYPIPWFYQRIMGTYPLSHFILTVRKDTETWKRSTLRWYAARKEKCDIEVLAASYDRRNAHIKWMWRPHFLEVCTDDDPRENASRVKEFLQVEGPELMPHLNSHRLSAGF